MITSHEYSFMIFLQGAISMNIDSSVKLFKMLGDTTRMQIILFLQGVEKSGREISSELNIEQSNLSHQMRNLQEVGIITSQKKGKCVFYSISPEFKNMLLDITKKISNPKILYRTTPGNPRQIIISQPKTHD